MTRSTVSVRRSNSGTGNTSSGSIVTYYELSVKIFEGSDVSATAIDTFITLHFSNIQCQPSLAAARTPVTYAATHPFFAESFTLDHGNDYDVLNVGLWELEAGGERQLGRVAVPRGIIEAGLLEIDSWFPVLPLSVRDVTVQGDVRLRIEYFEPKGGNAEHTYFITMPPNPYVVTHLLPDESAASTKTSAVADLQRTATFDLSHELHVSVWHSCENPEQDEFLGQFRIPLADVAPGDIVENWYPLLPRPDWLTLERTRSRSSSRISRRSMSGMLGRPRALTNERPKYPPKDFITALYKVSTDNRNAGRNPHKFVDYKSPSVSFCGHCGNIVWANRLNQTCKQCHIVVHRNCSKFALHNCTQVPTMRFCAKHQELKVLPWPQYERLLQTLCREDYALLYSIQQERDAAAMSFVRIFTHQNQSMMLVKAMIDAEVQAAPDTPTLFRGNSMTTKVLDAFMKHTGLAYLHRVLSTVIRYIISRNLVCEVDPTRMDRSADMQKNWRVLLDINSKICDMIFRSVSFFPPYEALCEVFAHLQRACVTRFPEDANVRYTAVSGFIFLRFFAAAVLGPRLFGLWDNNITVRISRTLTLCAKTLQNLANLVDFGPKEPYMTPMNEFLNGNFGKMKAFIDEISTRPSTAYTVEPAVSEQDASKECAMVTMHFTREMKRVLADAVGNKAKLALLKDLSTALTEIASQTASGVLIVPKPDTGDMDQESISSPPSPTPLTELPARPHSSITPGLPSPDKLKVGRSATVGGRAHNRSSVPSMQRTHGSARQLARPAQHGTNKNSLSFIGSMRLNSRINVQRNMLRRQSSSFSPPSSVASGFDSPKTPGSPVVQSPLLTPRSGPPTTRLPEVPVAEVEDPFQPITVVHPPTILVSSPAKRAPSSPLPVPPPDTTRDLPPPLQVIVPSAPSKSTVAPAGSGGSASSAPTLDAFDMFSALETELDDLIQSSTPGSPKQLPSALTSPPPLPAPPSPKPKPNTSQASLMAMLNMAVGAIDKSIATNAPPQATFTTCAGCQRFVAPPPSAPGSQSLLNDDPQRGVEMDGQLWHQECFACSVCDDELTLESAVLYKQTPYCLDDFRLHEEFKQVACGRCDRPVTGPMVRALDRVWHKDCFTCEVCNAPVLDGYIASDNRILCKMDFMQSEQLVCGVCGEQIQNEFVEVHGRKFHSHCKVCHLCKEPMVNKEFFSINDDDEVYCMSHYGELACCAACHQPLENEGMVIALAAQQRFHPDHFNCVSCGANLAEAEFYELDGRQHCRECFFSLERERSGQVYYVVAGDHRQHKSGAVVFVRGYSYSDNYSDSDYGNYDDNYSYNDHYDDRNHGGGGDININLECNSAATDGNPCGSTAHAEPAVATAALAAASEAKEPSQDDGFLQQASVVQPPPAPPAAAAAASPVPVAAAPALQPQQPVSLLPPPPPPPSSPQSSGATNIDHPTPDAPNAGPVPAAVLSGNAGHTSRTLTLSLSVSATVVVAALVVLMLLVRSKRRRQAAGKRTSRISALGAKGIAYADGSTGGVSPVLRSHSLSRRDQPTHRAETSDALVYSTSARSFGAVTAAYRTAQSSSSLPPPPPPKKALAIQPLDVSAWRVEPQRLSWHSDVAGSDVDGGATTLGRQPFHAGDSSFVELGQDASFAIHATSRSASRYLSRRRSVTSDLHFRSSVYSTTSYNISSDLTMLPPTPTMPHSPVQSQRRPRSLSDGMRSVANLNNAAVAPEDLRLQYHDLERVLAALGSTAPTTATTATGTTTLPVRPPSASILGPLAAVVSPDLVASPEPAAPLTPVPETASYPCSDVELSAIFDDSADQPQQQQQQPVSHESLARWVFNTFRSGSIGPTDSRWNDLPDSAEPYNTSSNSNSINRADL
ncbi:hypothetical protein RI367_005853 [Sorochytrium milnesiophthora]